MSPYRPAEFGSMDFRRMGPDPDRAESQRGWIGMVRENGVPSRVLSLDGGCR